MKTIPSSGYSGNQGAFIFIGQAGCQIGSAQWQLFNVEHSIQPDGRGLPEGAFKGDHFGFYKDSIFYEEDEFHRQFCYCEVQTTGKFVPRTLFIDLEPNVIDEIRTGSYRHLFSEDWSFQEYSKVGDGAGIFSRAYNTVGRCIITNIMNTIRHIAEKSERLNVFNIARSYGGATGSGLGSLLIEGLQDQFSKVLLTEANVLNFGGKSSPTMEPYNTLLGMETSCSSSGITLLFNNLAIKSICCNQLRNKMPLFHHINELICHGISGVYSSERFPGYGSCNINSILTNLIPYPRLQLATCSMSPILSKYVMKYEPHMKPIDMIDGILSNENAMFDIDLNTGSFISSCMIYRGVVTPFDISSSHDILMNKNRMKLVEWSPRGIKSGHSPLSIVEIPNFNLAVSELSMMMLSNHTNISHSVANVCYDVHVMLKKKVFLHWFIEHGLEEDDFKSALENAMLLSLDYKEIDLSPDYALNLLNDEKEVNGKKMIDERKIKMEDIDLLMSSPYNNIIQESDNENLSDDKSLYSKLISILEVSAKGGPDEDMTETLKGVLNTLTEDEVKNLISLAKAKGLDASFLTSFSEGHMVDADLNMVLTLTTLLEIKERMDTLSLEESIYESKRKDLSINSANKRIEKMTDSEREALILLAKSHGIIDSEFLSALQNGEIDKDQLHTLNKLLVINDKEMSRKSISEMLTNMSEKEKESLLSFAKSKGIEDIEILNAIQNGEVNSDNLDQISKLLELNDQENARKALNDVLSNMTDDEKDIFIALVKSQGLNDLNLLDNIQKENLTSENLKTLSAMLENIEKSVSDRSFLDLTADERSIMEMLSMNGELIIKPYNTEMYYSSPIKKRNDYAKAVESVEPSTLLLHTAVINIHQIRCALSTAKSYEESFVSCIVPRTTLSKIHDYHKIRSILNPLSSKLRPRKKGN